MTTKVWRSTWLLVLCALFLGSDWAVGASVVPLWFDEASEAKIDQLVTTQGWRNLCGGVPLACDNIPTSASQSFIRTRADALTDGFGGSQLSLRSSDPLSLRLLTWAVTREEATFHTDSDIQVRMQAFFPGITLFGVFDDPDIKLAYNIQISFLGADVFLAQGILTSQGFTEVGDDIGAIYDPVHHTVDVPQFNLDKVLGTVPAGQDFSIGVINL